ncbi:hypothetical protein [uncultured Arcobacter sp.]|uniref:hypothetical protein n=1 Tax=uncultured Arcobacter sp. TaxID=165434 RepID=UPI00261F0827|nr:hypothetical protein [uncultured Arcobacter sp.]
MVTINSSTLRANVFETVYDILTAANLLSSTVTVVGGYPDEDTIQYPIVAVERIDVSKDEPTFDRSTMKNEIVVPIDIYAKKNKQIDQITDEIDALSSLKSISGLMMVSWDESVDFSPQNNNKIHWKRINITYLRR